jgi:ankyrin repeat protein
MLYFLLVLFILCFNHLGYAANPDYDLLQAAKNGNVEQLRSILSQGKASISSKNNYGVSALIFAANNGHVDCVRYLLERGANIDDRSNNGKSSLLWAARWGHVEVVRLLLEYGANSSIQDRDGLTVLMNAVQADSLDLVRLLLQHSVNLTAKSIHGGTALSIAQARGNKAIIEEIQRHMGTEEVQSPYVIALQQLFATSKYYICYIYRVSAIFTIELWKNFQAGASSCVNFPGDEL